MKVHYINVEEWGIDEAQFVPFLERLKIHIPDIDGDLNVVFVNDDYIHSLNKAYRGKDKPTDVLSFPYLEAPDFEETKLIGEIYISIPTTKWQAEEKSETFEDELNKLFVHGFLHIYGHDHELDDDYKKMYDAECDVLQRKLPYIPREEME